MHVLITGAAGFIGSALSHKLLERGDTVVGLDNISPYYDPKLKEARLARLAARERFSFQRLDLADREAIAAFFAAEKFDAVAHLAAQAGVRYSIDHPFAYVDANLVGFAHVLEGCRRSGVAHLVFASTSSVYGAGTSMPFSEHAVTDHPLTLYAATKKANEAMAHSYAHLYRLPCTGLRFFTVYGPWGRPDMALFLFTRAILAGEPIKVFNRGEMVRDFTYVDDIVEGIARVVDQPAAANPSWDGDAPDPATSNAPWRMLNIGNSNPVKLMRYIEVLEAALGRKARLDLQPMQPGDVPATFADVSELESAVGFKPKISVEDGIARFVEWYRGYYKP